jgi:glycerol-3-phosphate cytidylyltransferase
VSISTDEFNNIKGKESVFTYQKRCEWVKSISYVDEIIPEKDWSQKKSDIENNNIDILVMGDDWLGKFDDVNCKVIYFKRTNYISSTEIKKIIS